ncbi:MAG: GspH/FimT family pseudopilin [Chromatiales bacterium]|jgi:type IV fimbrial biogenesis protein FimT
MQRAQTGFTLVELMITLAVSTIILTISIPAFDSLMTSNQTTAYTNNVIGALRLARSEAINRGEGVTVCASNTDYSACDNANWQNGWLVFTDSDDDRSYTTGSDELIRIWQAPAGDIAFNEAPDNIRFLPSGGLSSNVDDFALQVSGCNQARTISISVLGRAESSLSSCFE